ncbi:751_t:CDS:2, partial [Dentiscutata erythropus]
MSASSSKLTRKSKKKAEKAYEAVKDILNLYINQQVCSINDSGNENGILQSRQLFLNLCDPQLTKTTISIDAIDAAIKELDAYLGMRLSDQDTKPLT